MTVPLEYCTDEHIAIRAEQDFLNLCPRSQRLASGTDGAFSAGDLWTLTSASQDFLSRGVQAGNVVILTAPRASFPNQAGELLVVSSVATGQVTLRRKGLPPGMGMPPSPAGGLTGVSFTMPYFQAQIDAASYDANKFFGIDDNKGVKTTANMYDPRELQQFTVLTVLRRLYIAGEKTATGDYKLKLADVSVELDDLRARLTVHWGSTAQNQPPSSFFAARYRR